jgi:hypothetical protein
MKALLFDEARWESYRQCAELFEDVGDDPTAPAVAPARLPRATAQQNPLLGASRAPQCVRTDSGFDAVLDGRLRSSTPRGST